MQHQDAVMLKYLGWRNWALFEYNSITENIFLLFFLILRSGDGGTDLISKFLLFYVFSTLSTTYGYLVNDLGDRKLDRLHGKKNVFESDSNLRAVTVVIITAVLSFGFGLFFVRFSIFIPLFLIWFFLATFYSLPPLRLKEHGVIGLLAVVPAQRIIPALLCVSIFGDFGRKEWIIFVAYTAVRGFMSDVHHQIQDYDNDLSTETETCVARTGLQTGIRMFNGFLWLNMTGQIVVYFSSAWFLPGNHLCQCTLYIAAGIYVLILGIYLLIKNKSEKKPIDPYTDTGFGNLIHVSLPTFYFPLLLMVLHLISYPSSIVILILFLLGKKAFSLNKIKYSLPWRLLSHFLNSGLSARNGK